MRKTTTQRLAVWESQIHPIQKVCVIDNQSEGERTVQSCVAADWRSQHISLRLVRGVYVVDAIATRF